MKQKNSNNQKSPPSLSVVIPAYRQEKTIAKDLKKVKSVLEQLTNPFEIICVVDGKVDNTYHEAKKVSKSNKNIKTVGYLTNLGKGHAVRYGMARAKGDIVAFIDSGLDINPNSISMLLAHFEWYNADIIIGSKRHPVSKVQYPWQRQILSFGYQQVVKWLFGLRVKDTQVGIKFFRREVLEATLPRLLVKTFAFDIEILAVANYLGFKKIYEAPVEMKLEFGGASTMASTGFVKTIYSMLWDTAAVFYRLRILDYYNDKNKKNWITPAYLTLNNKK